MYVGLTTVVPTDWKEHRSMEEWLSLCVQVLGFIMVIAFSLFAIPKYVKVIVGVLLMFFTNIVAQIVIAGGGPGAFVGCFGLPFGGFLAAIVTDSLVRSRHKTSFEEAQEEDGAN